MFSSKMGPYNLQLICNKRVSFLAYTHILLSNIWKIICRFSPLNLYKPHCNNKKMSLEDNWKAIFCLNAEHISARSLATQKDVCVNGDVWHDVLMSCYTENDAFFI